MIRLPLYLSFDKRAVTGYIIVKSKFKGGRHGFDGDI